MSSSPCGHKCNTFCLFNGTRGFLSLPRWVSQRIAAGEQLGQFCSAWTPQGGSKDGGPPIKDSCHLFGLSSGKEYKEPFPCNQHSRIDQGIYLCKHKCEKLRAAKAV